MKIAAAQQNSATNIANAKMTANSTARHPQASALALGQSIAAHSGQLLPMPTPRECLHSCLARRLVTVRCTLHAVGAVPGRPHPLPICWSGRGYEQKAANDDAIFEYVVILRVLADRIALEA
jgi:hypothetical protein